MRSAKKCTVCNDFITCHGKEYRYINCKACHPSETNVCFDCYSHGHRCSGPNHELHLTFHDQNTDQQYTQSLDHTRDLLAIEAGCSDSVDPLLDLAKPSSMPKDWFRCLRFLPTGNEFELLECVLVDEEYPRTKLDD